VSDDGERDRSDRSDRTVERQIFLRSLNIARPLGSASKQLARAMRDTLIPAGATLYRRGDPAGEIYFVIKGEVELTLEGAEPWKLLPPSVVGILDVLQDRVRERTATALTDVHALALSAEDYFDVLEDNFEYARAGVQGIAMNMHQLSLDLAPTGGFPEPPSVVLPVPARPLNLVERTLALHEAPAFRAARVQGVTRLAGLAEEVRFAPGDVISRRGDPSDALLVVARGLVQVSHDAPRLEARFGAGSLVGGYASLGHGTHQFDTKVLAPTAALRVRREDFFDLLEDHFEVTKAIMAFLGAERERIYAERAARIKAGEKIPILRTLASQPVAHDTGAIADRLAGR
jgi:CRP-like cAMP-binding protein